MPPLLIGGAISDDAVWRLSVADQTRTVANAIDRPSDGGGGIKS